MKSDSVKLTLLFSLLVFSACSQEMAPQIVVTTAEIVTTPELSPANSILHRGDPGRTGYFHLPTVESPADVHWERTVGPSVHGAPMLVENTLLVPTVAARFVVLDAESGEEKWSFRASGDLFSSPAVAEDVIYIGNENGSLYALDIATGNELWTLEFDGGIWAAPLVIEEMVYVGSQAGTVYAVDTVTHRVRWQFESGAWIVSPPAWEDGVVFVSGGANLYALNDETGDMIWQKAIGSFGDLMLSRMA